VQEVQQEVQEEEVQEEEQEEEVQEEEVQGWTVMVGSCRGRHNT
jgi:hypothetical protein